MAHSLALLAWRDREPFERLYVDPGLPNREIASERGCSPETVTMWRRRSGLRGEDHRPRRRRRDVDESEDPEAAPEQTTADELLDVYHERV